MTSWSLARNFILARQISLNFFTNRLICTGKPPFSKMMAATDKLRVLSDYTNMDVEHVVKKRKHEDQKLVLRFTKISELAEAPTKGSVHAAGYDLRSAQDIVIPPQGRALVPTGLKVAIPDGHYGRIAPRSGLAKNHGIDVGAGVIDQDYRGPLGVILFNFGDQPFEVKVGERIAQLICEKICYPELEECDDLDETERGEGGFGSTGKK